MCSVFWSEDRQRTLDAARLPYYIYLFFQPARNEVETETVPCCVCVGTVIFTLQGVSKTYAHILLITHVAKLSRRLLIK